MKEILELHEFFVEGKNRRKSHVLLHITEPTTQSEKEKGYFFAVAELINGSTEQIEHIQKMIDDLESGFYETEDEEDKSAFEITLEYINRRGHHILQFEESELHAIVGVMNNGTLSFAYHGSPLATVFYKGKQERYQQMDIIDPDDVLEEGQLFSSLLEGAIKKDDFFFVASPHVAQYFSDDRLEKIITGRSTRQSTLHMQKVLTNMRGQESFGGILFHVTSRDTLPKTGKMPAHLKQGSAESLQKLMNAQKETSQTLRPPVMGKASEMLGNYFKKDEEHAEEQQTRKRKEARPAHEAETNHRPRAPKPLQKESVLNTILIALGKGLVVILQFCIALLQRLFLSLKDGADFLFIFITNKGGKRRDTVDKMRLSYQKKREAFIHLPLISKMLFLLTILLAIIFISSIFVLRYRENKEAEVTNYQNQVQAIIDKKDAAEASMIYGGDAKAFTLLKEAKELVEALPQNDAEQQAKASELAQSIEDGLMELRNVEEVTPELLADLFTTGIQTTKIALLGDTLIAYGKDAESHILVDAQTGSTEIRQHSALAPLSSASTPKENDFTLFISGTDGIATLDAESKNLTSQDISFAASGISLADLSVYNRRLYTLDNGNGQIYRHNATGAGYDQGSPWITSKTTDLSDAVSLAIDGDIYVLKPSGTIVKFAAGVEESFTIQGLDPALENPVALWTYNDVDQIYILEPTHKRLVILAKNGTLIKQITSKEWDRPTGMVIDDEANKAYILDNNKIYSVSL